MNRKRIAILIALMFTVCSSIAFSVVQVEKVQIVNELDNTNSLQEEFNKIKLQTAAKESENKILAQRELVIKTEKLNEFDFKLEVNVEDLFGQKEIREKQIYDDQILTILELTPLNEKAARVVLDNAKKYDLRPSFILGIIDLESSFNQYLVGTSLDRGYMQVIPGTEKWLVKTYGKELGITYNPDRIFEAEYNIALATKYLSVLKKEFNSNETMMLTAYNRGSGGLKKWYRNNGTYETAYSRVVLKREQKFLSVNR